jgi:hypothetical protein
MSLRLGMTYHLSFGDLRAGAAFATSLYGRIQDVRIPPSRAALLLNLADAFRVIERRQEAVRLLTESYSLGANSSMPFLAARTADKLATRAIENRDIARAELWMEEAAQRLSFCHDAAMRYEVAETMSRLLLLKGQATEAAVNAEITLATYRAAGPIPPITLRTILTTLAECLLACSEGPIEEWVLRELSQIHARTGRAVLHDRTAITLFRALERVSAIEAEQMLLDYVNNLRRGYGQFDWSGVGRVVPSS